MVRSHAIYPVDLRAQPKGGDTAKALTALQVVFVFPLFLTLKYKRFEFFILCCFCLNVRGERVVF